MANLRDAQGQLPPVFPDLNALSDDELWRISEVGKSAAAILDARIHLRLKENQ